MEAIVELVLGFFTVIGGVGSLFAFLKWLGAKLHGLTSPPKRTITVINHVNAALEWTVVVRFVVQKTVEVVKTVVPIIVPSAPPRQPALPDWLKPTRPEFRPGHPAEPRPDQPWRRPWTTRPQREPHVPEYTHSRPETFTRRPEPDGDYTTRLGEGNFGSSPRGGTPFGGRGGADRGSMGASHRGGPPGKRR